LKFLADVVSKDSSYQGNVPGDVISFQKYLYPVLKPTVVILSFLISVFCKTRYTRS